MRPTVLALKDRPWAASRFHVGPEMKWINGLLALPGRGLLHLPFESQFGDVDTVAALLLIETMALHIVLERGLNFF